MFNITKDKYKSPYNIIKYYNIDKFKYDVYLGILYLN